MMNDRGLILLSLFLAMGLWFHAKTEEVYTLRIPLVVDLRGLDTSRYVVTRVEPETVWVEMRDRGKLLLLHALAPRPHYILSLRRVRTGRNVIPLSASDVRFSADPLPREVDLVPSSILLQVERKIARRMPVRVPVDRPETLRVLAMSVRPSRVRVVAPRSVVNTLDVVVTETLRIREEGSVQRTLRLNIPPFSRVEPETVRVDVEVGRLPLPVSQNDRSHKPR